MKSLVFKIARGIEVATEIGTMRMTERWLRHTERCVEVNDHF